MPRRAGLLAGLVLCAMLTSPAFARDTSRVGGPVCPSPCTARGWNSAAMTYQAERIPIPGVVKGNWVDIGQWNAYLRLALIANQDPYKKLYVATYVRCWSPSAWAQASAALGTPGLMGFYVPPKSKWVNVPVTTCRNGAKAARGELSPTNIVALGTILHETFHRQGIHREDDATCLAAIGIWQAVGRNSTRARADRAWQLVIDWYEQHLSGDYRRGVIGCAARGVFAWNDSSVWR